MKKMILALTLVTTTLLTTMVSAQMKYLQGRDYTVLDQALPLQESGQKEVVEFFSYACPHCADLHPSLVTWAKTKKPDDVTLYEVPALGGSWTFVGQAKLTAQKLGLDSSFDTAYFEAIHQKHIRKLLGDEDAAIEFIADFAKLDKAVVKAAWDSLAVKNNLRKSAELWQQSGLTGVPVVVVNGKYAVSLSAAGHDYLFDVVDFLLSTTTP